MSPISLKIRYVKQKNKKRFFWKSNPFLGPLVPPNTKSKKSLTYIRNLLKLNMNKIKKIPYCCHRCSLSIATNFNSFPWFLSSAACAPTSGQVNQRLATSKLVLTSRLVLMWYISVSMYSSFIFCRDLYLFGWKRLKSISLLIKKAFI